MERIIEKDEILENYLNTINMGQNTLGVQAAAKRYFGKDVSELTLSECAALAAITKSPSGYNPITNPDANAKRREKVLKDMLAQEMIKQEDVDAALADDVYTDDIRPYTVPLVKQSAKLQFIFFLNSTNYISFNKNETVISGLIFHGRLFCVIFLCTCFKSFYIG